MDKKYVIWDLFGGGCNSLSRAIFKYNLEEKYTVYTFDVVDTHKESFRGKLEYDFHHYINIDLSKNNIVSSFKKMLKNNQIEKPDIITSSTLCQSFSKVLSMTGGGTCFWKQSIRGDKNSLLIERTIDEFNILKSGFTKNLNPDKQLFLKRLGEKCAKNSVELINFFKPKYWYIENPDSSMLFQYLKVNLNFDGILNVACYGAYGFSQNKSGGFYSNTEIIFSKEKRKPTYETKWEEISKEYYDKWVEQVMFKKNNFGGSGDLRHVKIKDGKYWRRWYVDIGYNIGDKGHSSLKKTTMTLGKLTKNKYTLKAESDFTTKQIGEANQTSHIPSKVIKIILNNFNLEKF